MKCAVCRNDMVHKRGEIDLRIEGKLYLVKNVSYAECASCGEKVLSAVTFKRLYEKINKKEFVEQTIRIPVLDAKYA